MLHLDRKIWVGRGQEKTGVKSLGRHESHSWAQSFELSVVDDVAIAGMSALSQLPLFLDEPTAD